MMVAEMLTSDELAAELKARVEGLCRMNQALAEQVDRMGIVTDAASLWARNDKGFTRIHLRTAVINYEAQMTALVKGGKVTKLTDNEQALLAREIAADKRVGAGGWYNDNMREVFVSGWNAAMEYVKEQYGKQAELERQAESDRLR